MAQLIYDGDTFALKANYSIVYSITNVIVEQTASGRKNLFVAEPGRLRVLDPLTGIEVWQSPELLGRIQPNSLAFADIDQNGTLELIFGTSLAMYATR